MKGRFLKNDRFVMRKFGDEAILVPLQISPSKAGDLYSLNSLGVELWDILEGKTFDELCDYVMSNYEIEEEKARRDVELFLQDLKSTGCISVEDE